jgi:hypothetical protein
MWRRQLHAEIEDGPEHDVAVTEVLIWVMLPPEAPAGYQQVSWFSISVCTA